MSEITRVGVDLAKRVIQVHAAREPVVIDDHRGAVLHIIPT